MAETSPVEQIYVVQVGKRNLIGGCAVLEIQIMALVRLVCSVGDVE